MGKNTDDVLLKTRQGVFVLQVKTLLEVIDLDIKACVHPRITHFILKRMSDVFLGGASVAFIKLSRKPVTQRRLGGVTVCAHKQRKNALGPRVPKMPVYFTILGWTATWGTKRGKTE